MGKREEMNAMNEELALKALSEDWLTAHQIARKLGMWEQRGRIAHALKRLHAQGKVEMTKIKTPAIRRSHLWRFFYRVEGVSRAMLPFWLAPQMPEVRIIRRQIFRCK